MTNELRVAFLPKAGELPEDSEDALGIASGLNSRTLRIAVADGASSGAFSGEWAQLWVQSFLKMPFFDSSTAQTRFADLSSAWVKLVYSRDLPWHAIARAERGGFTTFVGIEFSEPPESTWRAVAVGDSCVFQIRENHLIFAAPLSSSDQFTNDPELISTLSIANEDVFTKVMHIEGDALPGDLFVLATDAAARLITWTAETRPASLRQTIIWLTQDNSSRFVARLRQISAIQNDDLAVVSVLIG